MVDEYDEEDELDYDDVETMRIIDEFFDETLEDWYEKEKQDENQTIESYRKISQISSLEDEESSQ
jgi:hypothetical protein